METLLLSLSILGPFAILLILFLAPRGNGWVVYLSIFLFVSLFTMVVFWGVQEMAVSSQFFRTGPGRATRAAAIPGRQTVKDVGGQNLPENKGK